MNTNTYPSQNIDQKNPSYEIDLLVLCKTLWKEKTTIILVTFLITLASLIYVLTAKPIYQSQATLIPPPDYAIQDYNEGRIGAFRNTQVKELTAESVYDVFKKNLNSLQLKNTFFEEVYVPSLSSDEQKADRNTLVNKFNNVFKVTKANSEDIPNSYKISVKLGDAEKSAKLINEYIEHAVAATKYEIKNNIKAEQKVYLDTLVTQVKSLTETTKTKRLDEINRLKEALYVAEYINLENPSEEIDKASLGGNRYIDNDLIYTRGAKTLRAQLEVLESRVNDDPFIPNLRELNTQISLLRNYNLDDNNITVVTIDEAAITPTKPIEPRRKKIVIAGLLGGGMLGILAGLIRGLIRNRKNKI